MAKRFNLADYVQAAERTESDTPEIELLPWEKIHANEANFYAVDDVDELANSIAMHGLLDPVVITKDWQHPGEWVLISGHRRHKAWGILREKDPEKYAQIPAIVRQFESAQLGELALIMANSATRKLTPAEVSRQAERVEMLFYELKEQGYKFPPGRMRDQVAAAVKVSSSKLARLKVIREKLAAPWFDKWEAGDLAEDPAYKLAQLPADFQERLAKVLRKPTGEQISNVAEMYADGVRWVNNKDMTCPDGTRCQHFNSFLVHDAKCYSYSRCKGKTCCMECRNATGYGVCQSACSKAVAMRKDQKAKEEAKAEASRKREQTKLQKAVTASAARLVQALDAEDPVCDDEKVLSSWYGSLTAGDVRAIAAGTYDKWDKFHYSQDPLRPDCLDADTVRKLSTLTGASADWIMGLSDVMFTDAVEAPRAVEGAGPYEEKTGAGAATGGLQFRPGDEPPEEPTLAWCAFSAGGVELTSAAVWWPDPGEWRFEGGSTIQSECVGWYPLPDWRGVLRGVKGKEEK